MMKTKIDSNGHSTRYYIFLFEILPDYDLSDWILNINKLMLDAEFLCKMVAQCLYTITLRCMVSRNDKCDTGFPCGMNILL